MALAVAAAGIFAWQAYRNRRPLTGPGPGYEGVVVDLRAGKVGPSAALSFAGLTRQGWGGSTCWEQSVMAQGCFDTVPPSFAPTDYISIPYGTALQASGDAASATASLYPVDLGDPAAFDQALVLDVGSLVHPVSLHAPRGRYWLIINGKWPQGAEDFTFAITILPPSP